MLAESTRLNRLYSADTDKKTTILQHGLNFNPCSNNQKPLRGISEMKASKSRTDGAQLSSAGPPRNPPFTFVRRLTFTLLFDGERGGSEGVILPRLHCEPILYERPLKDDWQEARRFIKHTRGRTSAAADHDHRDGGRRNSSAPR